MSDEPLDDEDILARSGALPRRRMQDLPTSTSELILYQLSEMKAEIREGFQKIEGRFDRMEHRLTSLERFRERVEERERAEAQSSTTVNARWVPIALFSGSILVTIILFLVSHGGS